VQQLEGGVAYAIALRGISARRMRRGLNKAAEQLDLKLHWAVMPKDAKELVVELV